MGPPFSEQRNDRPLLGRLFYLISRHRSKMLVDFQPNATPDWDSLKAAYPGNVLLHVDWPFDDVAPRIGSRMAYLATPYSKLVLGRDLQWDRALSLDIETRTARWARAFALRGATVVSPIMMTCGIINADPERKIDPLDDPFWARWCLPMMMASGSVVIPAMTGWDQSRGVWREACWALQHDLPVYLIAPGSELAGSGT